ncbi:MULTISPECIES: SPFH domain-containing protein [unclassified Nocardioides]|uniref:SPFH domain-containing protein n=1 Tax=unclassified Nocardioides TaxID=2615069 RepID=UPI0007035575|nr:MULTISPECIES: SPFH domain-containing protein [unclassified Nocardioides]KRC46388.1 virion core protein (lumpy skin disease virus) [Nocardioides sp. Root79]KRC69734.1 virion core protein (lumpy skin disease virus) [Nocardioides sp. Root240]
MGLISAAQAAVSGVIADQWLEYFNCEALPENLLAVRGRKWLNSRGKVVSGSDNVISNGSKIAVADGQFMLIVEQGRILDYCAEPGEYVFDLGSEPSLLGGGDLSDNLTAALRNTWERFKFGGQPGKDARVYFFNTKELYGNQYGTPNRVPFRVVDANIGLDVDIAIRFFGQYSYRIVDPLLFYANVAGNFPAVFPRAQIEGQLKTELLDALQPAVARISALGIRYSALPGHTTEMAAALNDILSPKWRQLRGIEIVSFGVASVTASTEDEQMIKELQRKAVLRDPTMAAATIVDAQAAAMQVAAGNDAGAVVGFAGLGLAQGGGAGINPGQLYALGQQAASPGQVPPPPPPPPAAPAQAVGWACTCGATNTGKFCADCGTPKPVGAPQYQCDKCGWVPPDPTRPSKFCPECGDVFDDGDVI